MSTVLPFKIPDEHVIFFEYMKVFNLLNKPILYLETIRNPHSANLDSSVGDLWEPRYCFWVEVGKMSDLAGHSSDIDNCFSIKTLESKKKNLNQFNRSKTACESNKHSPPSRRMF